MKKTKKGETARQAPMDTGCREMIKAKQLNKGEEKTEKEKSFAFLCVVI